MNERRKSDKTDNHTLIGDAESINAQIGRSIPYLSIVYPRDFVDRYQLGPNPVIIGRGQQADIILADDMISREHCQVWVGDEGIMVEDLGSTNGTKIDNQPIRRKTMALHSRLQLGQFVLKAEYKDNEEIQYDQQLLKAATTDPLNGIANRQHLMERSEALFGLCRGGARMLTVAMLDIDHFKNVNDTWGRPAGDQVIKGVASILSSQCRIGDICGRYGGEEFLFVLPDISIEDAFSACEKIRVSVESTEFVWDGERMPVTVSVGMFGRAGRDHSTLEMAIERADHALYKSKADGRNRISQL